MSDVITGGLTLKDYFALIGFVAVIGLFIATGISIFVKDKLEVYHTKEKPKRDLFLILKTNHFKNMDKNEIIAARKKKRKREYNFFKDIGIFFLISIVVIFVGSIVYNKMINEAEYGNQGCMKIENERIETACLNNNTYTTVLEGCWDLLWPVYINCNEVNLKMQNKTYIDNKNDGYSIYKSCEDTKIKGQYQYQNLTCYNRYKVYKPEYEV